MCLPLLDRVGQYYFWPHLINRFVLPMIVMEPRSLRLIQKGTPLVSSPPFLVFFSPENGVVMPGLSCAFFDSMGLQNAWAFCTYIGIFQFRLDVRLSFNSRVRESSTLSCHVSSSSVSLSSASPSVGSRNACSVYPNVFFSGRMAFPNTSL